jgi:hypothetical protein
MRVDTGEANFCWVHVVLGELCPFAEAQFLLEIRQSIRLCNKLGHC